MSFLFGEDTSPEAEAFLIEGYRRMTPAQRAHRMTDMTRTLEILMMAKIRADHPNASEHELKMRLGSRWLDAETMRTVYGWDPEREGY